MAVRQPTGPAVSIGDRGCGSGIEDCRCPTRIRTIPPKAPGMPPSLNRQGTSPGKSQATAAAPLPNVASPGNCAILFQQPAQRSCGDIPIPPEQTDCEPDVECPETMLTHPPFLSYSTIPSSRCFPRRVLTTSLVALLSPAFRSSPPKSRSLNSPPLAVTRRSQPPWVHCNSLPRRGPSRCRTRTSPLPRLPVETREPGGTPAMRCPKPPWDCCYC